MWALIGGLVAGLCCLCCLAALFFRRRQSKSAGFAFLRTEGLAGAGAGPMLRLTDANAAKSDAASSSGEVGVQAKRHRGDTALHMGARGGLIPSAPRGRQPRTPMFKQFDVETGSGQIRESMGSQLAQARWKGAAKGAAHAARQEGGVRTGGGKGGSVDGVGGLMSSAI